MSVIFQVLTATLMKMAVFWDVAVGTDAAILTDGGSKLL
jgi:hypothetical protein